MSAEANKALRHRFVEELNKGRVLDELFAPDFVLHTVTGEDIHGSLKEMFSNVFKAFPDVHFTINDMIAEGDKVVERFTFTGTHTGEYMGIQPTNKKVTAWSICIVRIADGKFVEEWERGDTLGLMQQLGPQMMQQLGAIPTPKTEQ